MRTSETSHKNSLKSKQKQYTVDECLMLIGMGTFQYKILIVTGMIWGADAIEIMILTFLLPILAEEWNLNTGEDGTIGAVVFAGMLIGAIFWPIISDRYGRRWAVILCNSGQIIFGMLSAAAWDMYSMMILRFLTGFCLGGSSCSFTLYAEFAPKEDRGKLLVLQQSFWAVGAFFNALLAWLVLETLNWRWYLILSSVPLVFIVYLAWKLPESVQWLVTVGKIEEAEAILKNAAKVNNSQLIANINELKLKREVFVVNKRGNPMEIFSTKYFHTTVTCFIIMIVNCFTYYGVSFLSERFFDKIATEGSGNENEKYWKIAVTTSSEIPGILIGMYTLDRIGRKYTMAICFVVCAICTFCLIDENIQQIEGLSVTLVFLARLTASLAFLVIYIYFMEYYPTQVRNTAIGFGA
eukprot:246178_1